MKYMTSGPESAKGVGKMFGVGGWPMHVHVHHERPGGHVLHHRRVVGVPPLEVLLLPQQHVGLGHILVVGVDPSSDPTVPPHPIGGVDVEHVADQVGPAMSCGPEDVHGPSSLLFEDCFAGESGESSKL